jgi:hypothetical protein
VSSLEHAAFYPLEGLADNWWSISQDSERLGTFTRWLEHVTETRVAVVCHWGFITYLLNYHGYLEPFELPNAGVVKTFWARTSPSPAKSLARAFLVPHEDHDDDDIVRGLKEFLAVCREDSVLHSLHPHQFVATDVLRFPLLDPTPCDDPDAFLAKIDLLADSLVAQDWRPKAAHIVEAHTAQSALFKSVALECSALSQQVATINHHFDEIQRPPIRAAFHSKLMHRPFHTTEDPSQGAQLATSTERTLVTTRYNEIKSQFPFLSSHKHRATHALTQLRYTIDVDTD